MIVALPEFFSYLSHILRLLFCNFLFFISSLMPRCVCEGWGAVVRDFLGTWSYVPGDRLRSDCMFTHPD